MFLPPPVDNCPDADNPDQADWDGDGIGDACDPDIDGDGVANGTDNCALLSNMTQSDLDGDGVGDACDERDDRPVDTDGDGVANPSDNCVDVANPSQKDGDGDGVGNACEEAAPETVRVSSEISGAYANGVFSGTVTAVTAARASSASPAQCVADRVVKVKRKAMRRDPVVATAVTDATGRWSAASGVRGGRFYARAGRSSTAEGETTVVCERARSNPIRI